MANGNQNFQEGRIGANKQASAGGTRSTATNPSQFSVAQPTGGSGASSSAPGGATPYVPGLTVPQAPLGAPQAMTAPYQIPSRSGPSALDQRMQQFQGYAREGVQGYGNMLGRDFERQVGQMLGGINAIGGLRSGNVTASTRDMMDMYGRSVGDYASMATRDAMGMGQAEYDRDVEREYRQKADERARKSSRWGALGKLGGLALSVAFPAKTLAGKVGAGIMGMK